MKFTKMQGIGNDYVYVNCFMEHIDDPVSLAIRISDRHFGVGSDGLILICPSKTADLRMQMFNADGSESPMCGNGIRCVAKYAYDHKIVPPGGPFTAGTGKDFHASLRIETGAGILTLGIEPDAHDKTKKVCVNMGKPILSPANIPVNITADSVIDYPLNIDNHNLRMTCVSMGNPHAVFFCDDLDTIDLPGLGPLIEKFHLFPRRINVHFVKPAGPSEFTMRTWERGSGITLACGTGACACTVAAALNNRCQRSVTAHLPGGDLEIDWPASNNCVYMTGPAQEVFSGDWPG